MRVVLDSNVINAAFAARGLCAEVFELCVVEHNIIISEHILSEVQEKLVDKIRLPQKIVQDIITYLREQSEILIPEKINIFICRYKDDLNIIGTALSGKAKFIITGDNDLLTLKRYKDVKIVTPRNFWLHLRG
ncbi:MAG: putative toxin-antitoxin system toxin component, PIN family [Nitrospirae bacterium]|nr:putative toxin-antitoxin system toxin component, PIN family [Nitrospirota bacterium]